MTEQESREKLQEALIGELVLPLIPTIKAALEEMLTGRNKAARDMKAAYLIAELGRDLLLKGPDSRDVQKRKDEIMEVVRQFMAVREPAKPEEPAGFFADVERERSQSHASGDDSAAAAGLA